MLIEQAYRDYRDAMIRGMTSFSGDEQAALDAVSHAFTKALGNKLFLENMPEPAMKAWLYAAARNGLVDIKRREKRLAGFPEDELTEERQIDLADRVTVAALLVKLPQALRKPIQLKDREHLLDRYEKVNLNCGITARIFSMFEQTAQGADAEKSNTREDRNMNAIEIKNEMIVSILNQGNSEAFMTEARKAGARGGTVISARGISQEVMKKFFDISVQDEKEIIFILADKDKAAPIMQAVVPGFGAATKAAGVFFSLPVDQVMSLNALS
ncbi:hypothetical protein AGMMS50255_7580 [Spirochaetia bacterium]|nr:hypothetical protein AGMMS50255_7580 [Spirochaetia bacterium]